MDKGDAAVLSDMIRDSIAPGAKGLVMTSAKLARLQGVISIINFELAVITPSLEVDAPQNEDATSMSEPKSVSMDIEREGSTLVSLYDIGVERELFAAKSWSEFSRSLDMEIPTLGIEGTDCARILVRADASKRGTIVRKSYLDSLIYDEFPVIHWYTRSMEKYKPQVEIPADFDDLYVDRPPYQM